MAQPRSHIAPHPQPRRFPLHPALRLTGLPLWRRPPQRAVLGASQGLDRPPHPEQPGHPQIRFLPQPRQPSPDIAPLHSPGAFHCVQRYVRQAFLYGVDHHSGRSLEHRRDWIDHPIRLIAQCFAIAIDTRAVMSNHQHLVLRIDPGEALRWTDDEVAARWMTLFPPREHSDNPTDRKRLQLLADPCRIDLLRQRPGSLSWLMRCLAEPIARHENREHGGKERFWEGRYKCQALCDERAMLAAMADVDLNPIRAGISARLDHSTQTIVASRIKAAKADPPMLNQSLGPMCDSLHPNFGLSVTDYLKLLEWTGRALAPGKRGRIEENAPVILSVIDRDPNRWAARVDACGNGWTRAAGSAQDLIALTGRLGQHWVKAIRLALRLG